ncbi:MAG: VTT domain-containing protein [Byssovorax sp.]
MLDYLAGLVHLLTTFVERPIGYFLVMIPAQTVLSQPLEPATMIIAKVAPPWEIALLGALAAAVAAVFDYFFVRRVFRIAALDRLRAHRLFARVESAAKVAPFLTILLFAALPLPFVMVRVMMPITGYPLPRYVVATALGRLPRFYVLALFGKLFDIPNWVLGAVLVGALVLGGLGALLRKLGWIGGPAKAAPEAIAKEAPIEAPPPG